jgi:PleD family two-component response regulator
MADESSLETLIAEMLIGAADRALYQAKAEEHDRVVLA